MKEEVMGTKKSDCVAMFPESIEKVQKSMPKDCEIDKVVSFFHFSKYFYYAD